MSGTWFFFVFSIICWPSTINRIEDERRIKMLLVSWSSPRLDEKRRRAKRRFSAEKTRKDAVNSPREFTSNGTPVCGRTRNILHNVLYTTVVIITSVILLCIVHVWSGHHHTWNPFVRAHARSRSTQPDVARTVFGGPATKISLRYFIHHKTHRNRQYDLPPFAFRTVARQRR